MLFLLWRKYLVVSFSFFLFSFHECLFFRCEFALIASLVITGVSLCIQALNYIPSYIKTTFKFRTGVHTSLGDTYFEDYRIQAPLVGNLFGAMFYVYIILFFVAPVFRDAAVTVLIAVAGFIINVAIKACLMVLFRLRCFASFYRRHPAIANIMGLMFECWNIILAAGFVTLHAIKLVFTSLFYIGRIDVPMLQIYGRVRPWKVDFLQSRYFSSWGSSPSLHRDNRTCISAHAERPRFRQCGWFHLESFICHVPFSMVTKILLQKKIYWTWARTRHHG